MSDHDTPDQIQNPAPDSAAKAPAPRRYSRSLLVGTVALVGLAAVGAGVAAAQDARPFGAGAWGGGRFGEHGMRHEARFGDGGMRGAMMGEFMQWRIERALEEVDATPEQIERVGAIAEAAREDIVPLLSDFRGTREAFAEIFGADTIDRAAAETLRAERLAAMETASARALQAMLDAAEVLTPEQRAELIEEMGEHRGRGRW